MPVIHATKNDIKELRRTGYVGMVSAPPLDVIDKLLELYGKPAELADLVVDDDPELSSWQFYLVLPEGVEVAPIENFSQKFLEYLFYLEYDKVNGTTTIYNNIFKTNVEDKQIASIFIPKPEFKPEEDVITLKVIDGQLAIWESGGATSSLGSAWVVAGPNGEPLKPLYVPKGGHLCNGDHAYFPATVGMYCIYAYQHHGDFLTIKVWQIKQIYLEGKAKIEKIAEFDEGFWIKEPPSFLSNAIKAARSKALCYHCRGPHYYAKGD